MTFSVKMLSFSVCFLVLTSAVLHVQSKSDLTILHAPKGLVLRDDHELHVSKLKDILATILGYTVENSYDWRGFEIGNPFLAYANCVLMFVLPGVNDLEFPSKKTYPLVMDEDTNFLSNQVFSSLSRDTEMRFSESEVEGSLNMVLNQANEYNSSAGLVDELSRMKNIVNQMITKKNKNGVPDIYWITLTDIAQELQSADAKELITLTLNALSEKVKKIYEGKVFIAVITVNEQLEIRSKREISTKATPSMIDLNIAEDYSEDFPVIFNIILWFSLALTFSLLAISMVIAGMDPGRDSIIYRMTSTRMKKDN